MHIDDGISPFRAGKYGEILMVVVVEILGEDGRAACGFEDVEAALQVWVAVGVVLAYAMPGKDFLCCLVEAVGYAIGLCMPW